jgi:uncharacterized membrane protein YhaH (DUF805 family)
MKRFPASVHRSLDMVTVTVFLAAPLLLRMSGPAATLSYVLAGVHLIITLLTQFPDTHHRLIPLRAHGAIELIVGIALIALPLIAGWRGNERTFYVVIGAIILVVWILSNYGRQYGAERAQRAHNAMR